MVFLMADNKASAAISEQESAGLYAGFFDLSALWNGKLIDNNSGTPEIKNVSTSYIFDVSSDPNMLLVGQTLNVSQPEKVLSMQVGGGVLEGKLASGSWNDNPDNGDICVGGVDYFISPDFYNFSLCSKISGFSLTSSDPSIIDCSGQSCVATGAGTARITAEPLTTSIFAFGRSQNDGNEPVFIANPSIKTNSVFWDVKVYNPPSVTISADNFIVSAGESVTLSWAGQYVDSCQASGDWSGSKAVLDSETLGPLNVSQVYKITCSGGGGQTSALVNVSVSSMIKQPNIEFYSDVSTVSAGQETKLNWNVANASVCNAYSPTMVNWTGTRPVSGNELTGPIFSESEFWLTCTGDNGSASKILTIKMNEPQEILPSLSFSADRSEVHFGESVELLWAAENSVSCVASGNWSGTKEVSGSENTGPLSANVSYKLTCQNSTGQEETKTVDIKVGLPLGPKVDFWMEYGGEKNPSSVPSGANIVLKWSTERAIVCSASGSWTSSSLPLPSSYSNQYNITGTKIYNISCKSNDNVTVAKQLTITVDPPPITFNFATDKYTVNFGESAILTWNTSNANSCVASGDWVGFKPVNDSVSTGGIYSDKTYILQCLNTITNVSPKTKMINITANSVGGGAGPALDFWLTGYSEKTAEYDYKVKYNVNATLYWNSPTALSCIASGNWSGIKSVPSGSETRYNLRATYAYTLTCANAQGTTIKTINVESEGIALPEILSLTADNQNPDYNTGTTIRYAVDFKGYTSGIGCVKRESLPYGGYSSWSSVGTTSFNTGNLQWSKEYQVSCYSPSAFTGTVVKSITIDVGGTNLNPSLNFNADRTIIPYNNAIKLSWSAANSAYCIASGDWSGIKSLSSSEYSKFLTADSSFILSCFNTKAESSTEIVNVQVGELLPVISFGAPTDFIPYNTGLELKWDVQSGSDVSCKAEEGDAKWAALDEIGSSGTFQTENLKTDKIYKISCSNSGGQSYAVFKVSVGGADKIGPKINFWASDNVADENDKAVLNWNSSDASGCYASGDWSGNKGNVGTETVFNITSIKKYALTCQNVDGNLTVEVNVSPHGSSAPPMEMALWANQDSDIPVAEGTIIHWKVDNAVSCLAQSPNLPSWNGPRDLAGAEYTGPLNVGKYNLNLTCINNQGKNINGFLVLYVGQSGIGAEMVTPIAAVGDGVNNKNLPIKLSGTNTGGYMFDALNDYDKNVYLSWMTANAISCNLNDNEGNVYLNVPTNISDYNAGISGSKGRTFTLTCFDNKNLSNSINFSLIGYKHEVCLGSGVVVKGEQVGANAYYAESDGTGSPDLNLLNCASYGNGYDVSGSAVWGKMPETSAAIEVNSSNPSNIIVEGKDVYLGNDLFVTAKQDLGFGLISAQTPVKVDEQKDCFACSGNSCAVSSKVYKNLSNCPIGEYEDSGVCESICTSLRITEFKEVSP